MKKNINTVIPPVMLENDVLYHLEEGLTHILVCAPLSWDAEKVIAETNNKTRPGTLENKWCLSNELPNGNICDLDPDRKHWVLVC